MAGVPYRWHGAAGACSVGPVLRHGFVRHKEAGGQAGPVACVGGPGGGAVRRRGGTAGGGRAEHPGLGPELGAAAPAAPRAAPGPCRPLRPGGRFLRR